MADTDKKRGRWKYKHHRHTGFSFLFILSLDKWTLFYVIKELQCSLNRKFRIWILSFVIRIISTIFVIAEVQRNGIWALKFSQRKAVTTVIFGLYIRPCSYIQYCILLCMSWTDWEKGNKLHQWKRTWTIRIGFGSIPLKQKTDKTTQNVFPPRHTLFFFQQQSHTVCLEK